MHIEFCGAAKEVTGSCYLVECGHSRFLIDCGMHQGGHDQEDRNFDPFPFDPRSLDFVLLTHAHIDHSGLLPKLVKDGFSGPIYGTTPTCHLADIMLLDSAHIQESEAEWRLRKARRAGRKGRKPLYDQDDARAAQRLLSGVEYDQVLTPGAGVRVKFRDAGHILGSAMIELWLEEEGRPVKVVFSGDIGRPDQPIIRDPESVLDADYLVMESTYGDREHEEEEDAVSELRYVISKALESGGNIVIPSFAVGRTQEVVYYLRQIVEEDGPSMDIYVDSPLASEATEVYWRNRSAFDEEATKFIAENGSIFTFPELHYTKSADESRALNVKDGIIIISSSGMAEAGRIKHHLKHNLWREECHIVFVGYQAPGTLGRRLLDGEKMVKIFGEGIAVKATIHEIKALSAHADRSQLLDWAGNFRSPRLTLLTHGEPQAALSLKRAIESQLGFRVTVPSPLEKVTLLPAGV